MGGRRHLARMTRASSAAAAAAPSAAAATAAATCAWAALCDGAVDVGVVAVRGPEVAPHDIVIVVVREADDVQTGGDGLAGRQADTQEDMQAEW